MPSSSRLTTLYLLALSPLAALAKTDLSGCTTFTSTVTINPTAHEYGNIYESLVYYDPDTLEICTVPDCGGGRAAPKTGVPGCPLYSGTATPTPSFLSADPLAAPATTSGAAAETTSAASGPSSGDSSAATTMTTAVVTAAETEPSWFASMTAGSALATGSSTTTEESSTGAASTPSSSVDSSSGAALRVATGGLLFGLAISFLV